MGSEVKRWIGAALVALLLLGGLPASAAAPNDWTGRAARAGWLDTPAWADEFNAPAGTGPDRTKWWVETVDQGSELQTYVDDRRTSAHDGAGNMVLTAIRETSRTGRPYISGRLSNGFVAWNGNGARPLAATYGRWEARMKLPAGQGIWPAFWTLGAWKDKVNPWPQCGEIDIMESINWAKTTHASVHVASPAGQHVQWSRESWPNIGDGDWAKWHHTWRIDWTPGLIVWSLDGYEYARVTRADMEQRGGTWPFDGAQPQSPLLNLAVGGWAGAPGNWTQQRFLIDYVRVYLPINARRPA